MIPLTDNPVERLQDDAFGFRSYVEHLNQAVLAARPLPLTVGVFGGWGTGKSSFLKMWQELLGNEGPKTRTVWFNPWKYDRKVDVWSALLRTIQSELEEPDAKERIGRLARAAAWLSLRPLLGGAATVATAGVVGQAQVNALLDAITKEDKVDFDEINDFESTFADAVQDAVGEDGRLVIFIDDLDRCTPDSAITVLEALKLFTGHARCVFVLGLDLDVLAAVSTNKFAGALKGAPEEAVSGTRYLEKIVQLPFHLPEVPFHSMRSMLAQHVNVLADNDAFWELIEGGLGRNPRRVKRFVNVLELAALSRPEYSDPTRRLQLTKLLLIRSEHRAFFHQLTKTPDAWRALETGRATNRPELSPFENDQALKNLVEKMVPGKYHDFPPAPDEDEVKRMLSALRPAVGDNELER